MVARLHVPYEYPSRAARKLITAAGSAPGAQYGTRGNDFRPVNPGYVQLPFGPKNFNAFPRVLIGVPLRWGMSRGFVTLTGYDVFPD